MFDQNSGNSVDISKAFFETVIWKFESSQVSQPLSLLKIAVVFSTKSLQFKGFRTLPIDLRTPKNGNSGENLPKVSSQNRKTPVLRRLLAETNFDPTEW